MGKHFIYCVILGLFTIFSYAQEENHWESLLNAESNWKYSYNNSEIPSSWKNPDYNDSSWEEGPGGIGYGDNDNATIIPQTLSLYIRQDFNIIDSLQIISLLLYMDYDDGFIAYLNGVEIARANMINAGENPLYNVLTDDCDYEVNMPSGGIPDKFVLDNDLISANLKNGENCLAIEIHNCSSTSSDLSSSVWLIALVNAEPGQYSETPSWFIPPPDGTSHLPLIIINTDNQDIPDEPKITATMKVIDNGYGMTNSIYDTPTDYSGLIGIELRGQSSMSFPKKSYTIETRDTLGEDLKAPLLGMPDESDWVLSAPYSDKSMLRNAITYHFGGLMEHWAPRFRFCELYLNGDYRGIYLLMEKIKRDGDRVDIEKTFASHNAGDSLTGGYIIRVDKTNDLILNTDYFNSSPYYRYYNARNYDFSYYYPEADKITTEQKVISRTIFIMLKIL